MVQQASLARRPRSTWRRPARARPSWVRRRRASRPARELARLPSLCLPRAPQSTSLRRPPPHPRQRGQCMSACGSAAACGSVRGPMAVRAAVPEAWPVSRTVSGVGDAHDEREAEHIYHCQMCGQLWGGSPLPSSRRGKPRERLTLHMSQKYGTRLQLRYEFEIETSKKPCQSPPTRMYVRATRAGSPQPTPPAARAAGHIERFVRVAHSSQPGAADSFCAPTAGDAVLPLS